MFERFLKRKRVQYDSPTSLKDDEDKFIVGNDKPDERISVAHANAHEVETFSPVKKELDNQNEYVNNDDADMFQEELIAKEEVNKKKDQKYWNSGQDRDAEESHWITRAKVSNERNHSKLGDKNSGIPRGENLVEEQLSKQEIFDEHLGDLMEQEENTKFARDNFYPEEYDEDEDQDLEKAA